MEILKALKETGKATALFLPKGFWAATDDEGILWLYDTTGKPIQRVPLDDIFRIGWEALYDKPVIKPEKAGELWRHSDGGYWHTEEYKNEIRLYGEFTAIDPNKTIAKVTHGQSWTREFPPVEDEGVDILKLAKEVGDVGYKEIERIEIYGIGWNKDSDGVVFPSQDSDEFDWKQLVDKPCMKVIFEIPREA